MTSMRNDKLLNYNEKGFIPGPGETEDKFYMRVDYCLSLRKNLDGKLPFSSDNEAAPEVLKPGCQISNQLYDIAPDWVPAFFSNYQLPFWHGGCAWIFQLTESDPTAAIFQLRKNFHHSSTYLAIYQRDELIAHELVHVSRMMYHEPKYEELLAYATFPYKLRRWVGPIVQSSSESAWFVFSLMPIIFFDLYFFLTGSLASYSLSMWLKLIPIFLIIAALFRLGKKHATIKKTLKNLNALVKEKHHTQAVLLRLTDQEIDDFSKMPLNEIKDYILTESSFRWHVIRQAYFV